MNKSTTQVIRNATFYWAKLDNPVDPFGGGAAWEIQLRTEDSSVAEQWADQKQNVKKIENDDGVYYQVNLKRYAQSADGSKQYMPPSVVDGNKDRIADVSTIGNGSKGHAKVYTYQWSRGGKSGWTSQFTAIQITELVEYTPEADIEF